MERVKESESERVRELEREGETVSETERGERSSGDKELLNFERWTVWGSS